jgi:hypothetical protein
MHWGGADKTTVMIFLAMHPNDSKTQPWSFSSPLNISTNPNPNPWGYQYRSMQA